MLIKKNAYTSTTPLHTCAAHTQWDPITHGESKIVHVKQKSHILETTLGHPLLGPG